MTNQHPITPPPELVRQWLKERPVSELAHSYLAAQAARWGGDQELEACCNYFEDHLRDGIAKDLRVARRSKPPSLKEQALDLLNKHNNGWAPSPKQWQTIRLAVEALSE